MRNHGLAGSSGRREGAAGTVGALTSWKACPRRRLGGQFVGLIPTERDSSRLLPESVSCCPQLWWQMIRVLWLDIGVAQCGAHSEAWCPLPRGCSMPGCPGFVSLLSSQLLWSLHVTPAHPSDARPGLWCRGGASRGFAPPDTFMNYWARKINSLLIKFADVAKL